MARKRRSKALARRPHPHSLAGVWDRASGSKRILVAGVGVVGLAALWWAFSDEDPRSGDSAIVMPWTLADFVSNVYAAIDRVAPSSFSLKSKLMVLAHAAYESGWGKSTAAKDGNNLFNITAGSAPSNAWWDGSVVLGGDTEYDSAGNVRNITQKFRSYYSIDNSIGDYLQFLQGSRYSAAYGALVAGDPVSFVQDLRNGGYFTLPVAQYQTAFLSVLQRATNEWGGQQS